MKTSTLILICSSFSAGQFFAFSVASLHPVEKQVVVQGEYEMSPEVQHTQRLMEQMGLVVIENKDEIAQLIEANK